MSIGDEDFDEDDLECWMEGLTPEQYYKDLKTYGCKKTPFKIGKLSFELEIRDFNYTVHVSISLRYPAASGEISREPDSCIANFNEL